MKTISCPLNDCGCEGVIRIGDRVRLHSGDYDLETPVENVNDDLLGHIIVAKSATWAQECVRWHKPRLPASEAVRQLRMAVLDDEVNEAVNARLRALPENSRRHIDDILEQITIVFAALDD